MTSPQFLTVLSQKPTSIPTGLYLSEMDSASFSLLNRSGPLLKKAMEEFKKQSTKEFFFFYIVLLRSCEKKISKDISLIEPFFTIQSVLNANPWVGSMFGQTGATGRKVRGVSDKFRKFCTDKNGGVLGKFGIKPL